MIKFDDVIGFEIVAKDAITTVINIYKALVLKDTNDEPMDGDEVETMSKILNIVFDFHEGNITGSEGDTAIQNLLGDGKDAKDS